MSLSYQPHRRLLLKSHPEYSEKWLQQHIAENPSLLGLGDLDVKDMERNQPRAGRLDLLLFEPETNTRYEVELQLGSTDESHIIRTIEYWDIERRRYPQYEHVAVIVAETITARFFNVISLFNGFIPIVAIQLNAIQVEDAITLVFTTVLDRMPLGVEEEEEADEPRDRGYWEGKASSASLSLTDRILDLVREVEPAAALKYNKNYIGISRNGSVSNFVAFRPRKKHVLLELKIPRCEELSERLEEAGVELLTYQTRWGQYRISVTERELKRNRDLLLDLIGQAHRNYGP